MGITVELVGRLPGIPDDKIAIAVPVGADARALPRWTAELPDALTDCLFAALNSDGFEGKLGQSVVVHSSGGAGILYGTGKVRGADQMSQVFGHLISAAAKAELTRIVTPLPAGKDVGGAAEAAVIGAMLANGFSQTGRMHGSAIGVDVDTVRFNVERDHLSI